MLKIDQELKELYKSDSIEKHLILDFYRPGAAIPFLSLQDASGHIMSESMEIEESLSSSENLDFGSCEASQFKITLIGVEENIKGAELAVYQSLAGLHPAVNLYPGSDVFPSGYIMPLGRYTIQTAELQANQKYRDLVALDFMRKFDVNVIDWYNALPFPMTLKAFRASLCRQIGMTEHVPDYLPNDDMMVEKTIEASELMGRQVLIACEQINGVFGHFDREGILQHVTLQPNYGLYPALELYPAADLFPVMPGQMNNQVYDENIERYLYKTCTFEEHTVQSIEKIQIRQEEGDIGAIYGTGTNCLTVEGNFLVFGKSAAELERIAGNLYGMVNGRQYRPFECELKGLPYLEVGDTERIITEYEDIVTYILKRTLKGIYALKDSHSATGEEIRSVENNINTEIIQLKGKAAILRRNVDEVSANLVDFEAKTETLIKQTAADIRLEVKNFKEGLESEIVQTAGDIRLEVKNVKAGLESSITQTAGDIRLEVNNTKSDLEGQISLKVSKGDVTGQLNSELKITGNSIDLTTGHFTIDAQNLKVDNAGNVAMAGEISADSGKIGNWTISDGKLEGDTGSLRGAVISGGHISGTTIDVADSILQVEDGYGNSKAIVRIGAFVCSDEYGRGIFQSADEMTGMSGDVSKSGGLYLWAGYNGSSDYAFVVNNKNETHVKGSLHVSGSIYLNGSQVTASGGSSSITGTVKKMNIGYDVNGEWGYDWLEIYPKNLPDINKYPEYEGIDYFYLELIPHYKNE